MGTPRRVMRLNRVAQAALVAGIVVAVNVIAQRWYARVDLTERREYSLAPSTRRVLAGLDDTVVVNGYFSRRLPPYLLGVRQQVQDLLEEYRARSGGRVTIEITDPGDDPAAVQRLRALGIPQLQLEVLERDRFQVTNAWLGLAVLHGGRQEVIPVIQDTATLEYDLTAALLRLTSPEKKVVGWLGGDGEREDGRGGGAIRRELARLYELRSLEGEGLEEVPAEVGTLVADGPRDLPPAAVDAIDRFVRGGGRAVFLVDHLELPPGTLAARPVESGLEGLLERYGAKVGADVVAEPHFNAPASFSTGFLQFRVPYPYWVRVTGETLDREHPVTAKLENLVLPWAGSLEAVVPEGGAVRAEALARSSPEAWVETGPYDFMPQPGRATGPRGPVGQRTLALLLSGRFPAPEGEAPEEESAESSVLVVGTSRFADPDFLRQFPENAAFLLNAVDWMTMGPELIGIRSRVAAERMIPDVGDRLRAFLKGLNVIGVPLLAALLGIVRLQVRRRRERTA